MDQQASGRGGARRAAIGFILFSVCLDVLSLGVTIPVYAPLIQRFEGGDAAAAGWYVGLFTATWCVAQFFGAPVLGALSDQFGRRPVLLISLFGLALDYLLLAFAPSLGWLFVGRVLSGITAASWATANAYIADVTPEDRRAGAFGMVGAAWGVGFIVGPAVGGALALIDLRAPFLAAAGLTLIGALYGLFVLPESLSPEKRARFRWSAANPVGSLLFLRSRRELLSLSAVNFLLQLAHNVLPTVFILYTSNRYGWTPLMTGAVLGLFGIGNILVQGLLVKRFVARFGEWAAVLTGLVSGVVGFSIYGLAPSGWLFLLGSPVFSLIGLFGPGFQALVTRQVAASEQGRLQGATASLTGLAGILGPLIFGYAYAWFVAPGHPQVPGAAFLLAAAQLALAAFIAAVLMRRPRHAEVAA
jgi:DHA1 family tetracycline resistance protein-like MFS transporter